MRMKSSRERKNIIELAVPPPVLVADWLSSLAPSKISFQLFGILGLGERGLELPRGRTPPPRPEWTGRDRQRIFGAPSPGAQRQYWGSPSRRTASRMCPCAHHFSPETEW